MAHEVNEMISIKNEFTILEIHNGTIEEMHNEIKSKVDDYFNNRIKELELKAIKGKPSDIMNYNLFISNEKFNRADIKRRLCEELDLILKGSLIFMDT